MGISDGSGADPFKLFRFPLANIDRTRAIEYPRESIMKIHLKNDLKKKGQVGNGVCCFWSIISLSLLRL